MPQQCAYIIALQMIDGAPKERPTDGNERPQKAGPRSTLETYQQFQNERGGCPHQQKTRQVASPRELSTSTPLRRDISEHRKSGQVFEQAKIDRHILKHNLICDAKDRMPGADRA